MSYVSIKIVFYGTPNFEFLFLRMTLENWITGSEKNRINNNPVFSTYISYISSAGLVKTADYYIRHMITVLIRIILQMPFIR